MKRSENNPSTAPKRRPIPPIIRPPPRRQRFDAQDASRIQKLYRRDRKKATQHIFQNMKPFCEIPRDNIQSHLTQLFSNSEHAPPAAPDCIPQLPTARDDVGAEVARRLARMNTAPGPDGVRYHQLRKIDPACCVLASIYARCMELQQVPPA